MSIVPLLVTAAESTPASGVNPWFVGISVFVIMLALMGGLLAFGRGRDHS